MTYILLEMEGRSYLNGFIYKNKMSTGHGRCGCRAFVSNALREFPSSSAAVVVSGIPKAYTSNQERIQR